MGTKADLDLYLYNESARFATSADILGSSNQDRVDTNPANPETETITVTLSAGNYLINVNAYTGGGLSTAGNTNYHITVNGNLQCPANIVQ